MKMLAMKKLFTIGFLLSLLVSAEAKLDFIYLAVPTNEIVTVYTNKITAIKLNASTINDIVKMARPIVDEYGNFGRQLDAGYINIEGSGDTDGIKRLNNIINSPIIVSYSELTNSATVLGLNWGTTTGIEEVQIETHAFISKVAQLCGFSNEWVSTTYYQLMMWVNAQLQ